MAERMALRRWNLEALTGVLGYRMLDKHRQRLDKNIEAEDAAVRKKLWGSTESNPTAGDEMGDQIVLGNLTHPTPIIMPQQQSGSIGKVLAGAAIAAGLMGIPAAGVIGFGLSKILEQKPATASPSEDTSLDIGLGRFEDLLNQE